MTPLEFLGAAYLANLGLVAAFLSGIAFLILLERVSWREPKSKSK